MKDPLGAMHWQKDFWEEPYIYMAGSWIHIFLQGIIMNTLQMRKLKFSLYNLPGITQLVQPGLTDPKSHVPSALSHFLLGRGQ